MILPGSSKDLQVAYRLNAVCIEASGSRGCGGWAATQLLEQFRGAVVVPAMRSMGESHLNWWNNRARATYVHPPLEGGSLLWHALNRDLNPGWKELVATTARIWTAVADQYAVTRLPIWEE